MKSLTKPELNAFLSVARKYSERDYLFFQVTFNHGLRVSEALGLTSANIVGNYLVVQRLKKSRKTSQPLFPNEKDALLTLAAAGGKFFEGEYRMSIHRKIRKYGAEAGIEEVKLHAHAFKHSCGRLALEAGISIPDIQRFLGHVSGSSTLVYLESDEDKAAAAFAAVAGGY